MSAQESNISDYLERCKCCLGDSGLQKMWGSNTSGEKEVFGELFMECFALSWEAVDTEVICENCVMRLRDAVRFKKDFLTVQEILQGVHKGEIIITIKDGDDLTVLSDKDESINESNSVEYLEIKDQEEKHPEEDIPDVAIKKKRVKRKRQTIQYTLDELENAKRAVKRGMSIMGAAEKYGIPRKTLSMKLSSSNERDKDKCANQEKFIKFVKEIRAVLTHTNATPFKSKTISKTSVRYYCAYCSNDEEFFEDADILRSHTKNFHKHERIRSVELFMRPLWHNEILKLDVMDLRCSTCSLSISDWNSMFLHFAEIHNLEFDEAYRRIIPYCLGKDLKCVLCSEGFSCFQQVDGHMNQHYCNYICYTCGDPFCTSLRLDIHMKIHKGVGYPCSFCERTFKLEAYRSKHISLSHKSDTAVKCSYCPEVFGDSYKRYKHISELHPEKIEILSCEYCGKTFNWKPFLITHKRREHANEKRYECDICGKKFTMKYQLRNHMLLHADKKKYLCGICGKAFNLLRYLKGHRKQHV